jgi:hypothetical protein
MSPRAFPASVPSPEFSRCPRHNSKGDTVQEKLILGAILALLLVGASVSIVSTGSDATR